MTVPSKSNVFCGGQSGFRLNITLKSVLDFVNDLQTEKLPNKWIPSNRVIENITKMILQKDIVLTGAEI